MCDSDVMWVGAGFARYNKKRNQGNGTKLQSVWCYEHYVMSYGYVVE